MTPWLRLASVAFALHWVWEMLQMPAYAGMSEQPLARSSVRCAVAALGDVVLSLMLAVPLWWWPRRGAVWALVAGLGVGAAVGIEVAALAVGRWSYTQAMPLLPGLRVGAWPVLQMALLPGLAACLAWRARSR